MYGCREKKLGMEKTSGTENHGRQRHAFSFSLFSRKLVSLQIYEEFGISDCRREERAGLRGGSGRHWAETPVCNITLFGLPDW